MSDAELRAKAEAATPGPLHLAETGSWHTNTLLASGSNWPHDDTDPIATEMSDKDAAYWIAVSPDAVLALLDRVEAAEAAVERVRAALDRAESHDGTAPTIALMGTRVVRSALDGTTS